MKQSDILSTAIKIFGIYYLVQFVQHFLELLSVIYQQARNGFQSDSSFIYITIIVLLVVDLAFGYLGTIKTDAIVNRISKPKNQTVDLTLNKTDWIEVSMVAIGIIAMTFSIPELLYNVVENVYFHNHREVEFFTRTKKSEIFLAIFKLVAGLFLILNARNFSKKINRLGELDDKIDAESKR